MKVLILGGAGFVGANLAVWLAPRHEVAVMDNLVRRGSEYNLERLKEAGVTFTHGDVRAREDFPAGPFDMVLDCAAQASAIDGYARPEFDITNNTVGVLNVLGRCREWGAGIIFWASNKIYPAHAVAEKWYGPDTGGPWAKAYVGDPILESCPLDGGDRSMYGVSKVMSDLLIQEWCGSFDLPFICNRFSCLAGPWQWGKTEQGWVAWWVIAHELGLPLKYIGFDGKQVRDVLYIDDVCRLVEGQMEKLVASEHRYRGAYNVGGGSGNACSLIQMTELCRDATGHEVPITVEPLPRRADFAYYVSDITKVSTTFGWWPKVGLREGVVQIYRWVQDNRAVLARMYGGT